MKFWSEKCYEEKKTEGIVRMRCNIVRGEYGGGHASLAR